MKKRQYKTVLDINVSGVEQVEIVVEADSEDGAIAEILLGRFKRFLPLSQDNVTRTLNTQKELVFEVD